MKSIIALAITEIRRNVIVLMLPLAPLLAVLLLSTPVGARLSPGRDLLNLLAMAAIPLSMGPPMLLGFSLLGPDVRAGRLSFFFTRPCEPWRLFVGRFLGAATLTAVGVASGVATAAAARFASPSAAEPVAGLAGALSLAIALLLIMNALALILVAGSSTWVAVDFTATLLFVAGCLQAAIGDHSAYDPRDLVAPAGGLMAGLVAATTAYLRVGRGSATGAHRAHSLSLWTVAGMALVGLLLRQEYAWRQPISAVLGHAIAVKGRSEGWVLVDVFPGRKGGTRAAFLLDTRTGESRRLGGRGAFAASADVALVFSQSIPIIDSGSVRIEAINGGRQTGAGQPIPGRIRGISADSRHVLSLNGSGLVVAPIDRLSSPVLSIPARDLLWAEFTGNSTLVAAQGGRSDLTFTDFDLSGRTLSTRSFPIKNPAMGGGVMLHHGTGRVLVHGLRTTTAYDRDGRILFEESHEVDQRDPGRKTSTQRILTERGALMWGSRDTLSILDPGTRIPRTLKISPGAPEGSRITYLHGEAPDGSLIFSGWVGPRRWTALVDSRTGKGRVYLPGLWPVAMPRGWSGLADRDSFGDTPFGLFQDEDDNLHVLDSGATKPRLLVKSTAEGR